MTIIILLVIAIFLKIYDYLGGLPVGKQKSGNGKQKGNPSKIGKIPIPCRQGVKFRGKGCRPAPSNPFCQVCKANFEKSERGRRGLRTKSKKKFN